jgi:leucyl aminopeptidase
MALEFTLNHAPAAATVDCLVVGAYADCHTLTPAAQALDAASGGRLAALAQRGACPARPAPPPCCTTCRA